MKLRQLLAWACLIAPVQLLAAPAAIDVVGLVPGQSDADAVRAATGKEAGSDVGTAFLEVGGHKLPCAFTFSDGKLSQAMCLTGTAGRTEYTRASNAEVHRDLVIGFTKKFGPPFKSTAIPLRTRGGRELESSSVRWRDKQGNELELMSHVGSVDQGMVQLRSAAQVRKDAAETAANEAKKRF